MTTQSLILAALCAIIVALSLLLWINHERRSARPMTFVGYLGVGLGLLLLAVALPSGNWILCLPGAFFLCACLVYARRPRTTQSEGKP